MTGECGHGPRTPGLCLVQAPLGAGSPDPRLPQGWGDYLLESSRLSRQFTKSRALGLAAHIFASAVIDGFVPGKFFSEVEILARFIRHKNRLAADLLRHDRAKRFAADLGDMFGASAFAAFYKGMNHLLADAADVALRALVAVLVLLFSAYVGRIRFNDFAFATERIGFAL